MKSTHDEKWVTSTDCHDITEILWKVALNIITYPSPPFPFYTFNSLHEIFYLHNHNLNTIKKLHYMYYTIGDYYFITI